MSNTISAEPAPSTADSFAAEYGVETNGVDTIPESERTATPWTFLVILVGGSMSLANVVFGWLAVTFGLSFWQACSAIVVGITVGSFLVIPMILIGSVTATNNSTASGAHFGVRGRIIGSVIGLAISLFYTALGVWTGGDAIVSISHRVLGTPETGVIRGVVYGVLTLAVIAIAMWGFKLLARFSTLLTLVCTPLLLLMIPALAGDFQASTGGDYLLGNFTDTWILAAVTTGIASPLSMVTVMGDWTRYISPTRYPARRFLPMAIFAIIISQAPAECLGAFAAASFTDLSQDFIPALVAASPMWYAILLLPLAVLSGLGLSATTVYSSGLDLEALLPKVSRLASTAFASAVSILLVFLGAFVLNAQNSISAVTLILTAIIAPWVGVTATGYIMCRQRYDSDALQVFNRRETGGRYWFVGGWNLRAVVAFLAGATFGVLAVDSTPLYVGPWSGMASGVDVSFLGSLVISAVLFPLLEVGARLLQRRAASGHVGDGHVSDGVSALPAAPA